MWTPDTELQVCAAFPLMVRLAVFVESIDEETRNRHEVAHLDPATGVRVFPTFIRTAPESLWTDGQTDDIGRT